MGSQASDALTPRPLRENILLNRKNMRTLFSIIILLSSTCISLGLAGFACPVNNVNFNLNDLDHPIFNVKSWQDCGKMCQLVPGCRYWSYNESSNQECYLKHSNHGLQSIRGVKSGERGCPKN